MPSVFNIGAKSWGRVIAPVLNRYAIWEQMAFASFFIVREMVFLVATQCLASLFVISSILRGVLWVNSQSLEGGRGMRVEIKGERERAK